MSLIKWIRKMVKCSHIDLNQRFIGYHTGDDRHTHDEVGAVYVRRGGTCPDCNDYIFTSVRLPKNLRDLFWANFNHCMEDDPAVIANKKKEVELHK